MTRAENGKGSRCSVAQLIAGTSTSDRTVGPAVCASQVGGRTAESVTTDRPECRLRCRIFQNRATDSRLCGSFVTTTHLNVPSLPSPLGAISVYSSHGSYLLHCRVDRAQAPIHGRNRGRSSWKASNGGWTSTAALTFVRTTRSFKSPPDAGSRSIT